MFLRRAAPQAKLGATKHQPFVRHYTSHSGIGLIISPRSAIEKTLFLS
jgi:hypothetical protein